MKTGFGLLNEYSGDSTQLLYLRARQYSPGIGRFLTKDSWVGNARQPLSFNKWAYVNGSPTNYNDPTGHYPVMQIASSYGLSIEQLIDALQTGKNFPALHNKWDWINLLMDAHDGQSVQIGSPASFPPYLDMWPTSTISLNNKVITLGNASLLSYIYQFLDNPLSPVIWWRNTKPNHYYLDTIEYYDIPYHDLPAFRTISADLLFLGELNPIIAILSQLADAGATLTIDRFGNVYGSLYAMIAPSIGGSPLSFGEGYINHDPSQIYSSIMGQGFGPSESEIIGTLTSWCTQGGINALTGSFQLAVCGGKSSAFMYGYTLSLVGDSIGASYTFEPITKIPQLAWDYLDRKPNVNSSDVINRIKLDVLLNPCP